MKKILPLLLILCLLCACAAPEKEHDLSTYEANGYYTVLASDTVLYEYGGAAVPELILSDKALEPQWITFEKAADGGYTRTAAEDYTFSKENQTSAYRLFRDDASSGTKVYPEQFALCELDGKYYYSVGGLTVNDGYSASSDGKIMVFEGNDGRLLQYKPEADTLTAVGSDSYGTLSYTDAAKGWIVDFALSEDGRYAAYTSTRRTAAQKAPQTDLWLCSLENGEEKLLTENVSVFSGLDFDGTRLFYCTIGASEGTSAYTYIGMDVTDGTQLSIDWDNSYTTVKNGWICGQNKVYNIAEQKAYTVDSTVDGSARKGILSEDGKYTVTLYGDEENLYVKVVEVETSQPTVFLLPGDFKNEFLDFHLLDMREGKILLQCMLYNADKSGDFTAYYTVDLSWGLK
ncbi:MAG: hypothetical protein ACOYKJ_06045 [Candidatus Howiella sp.]|jgi:hypothetical protein